MMTPVASTLATILESSRAHTRQVSNKIPTILSLDFNSNVSPCVSSTGRGTFLISSQSATGTCRFGFSDVLLTEEGIFVQELASKLKAFGEQQQWDNTAPSIEEAVAKLAQRGLKARYAIFPRTVFSEEDSSKWEVEKIATMGKYVKLGVDILVTDTTYGIPFVVVGPKDLGVYIRIGDYVGTLIKNADRNVVLVP